MFDPVFEERTRQIAGRVDIPHLFSIGGSSIAPDFLEAASQAVGLDVPYRRARAAFYAWAGKQDD